MGRAILHVFNGDSAAGAYRSVRADDPVLTSRDSVSSGPTPPSFGDAWITVRARFLAEAYDADVGGCRAELSAFEEEFSRMPDYEEVVLWYGRDLFCLVVMLSHVARAARIDRGVAELSIVCPDGPAATPPYYCLGELPPEKVADLVEDRLVVDDGWIAAAEKAWRAYTSDDPTALNAVLDDDDTPRLVRRAIALHAARFPDKTTGLGAIERALLDELASGPATFPNLFVAVIEKLPDYGWGDLQLRNLIWRLIDRPHPLVDAQGAGRNELVRATMSITSEGARCLQGDPELATSDRPRWLGGVELAPGHPWRYDAAQKRVVKTG